MFKVGDLITGIEEETHYAYTNHHSLCMVTREPDRYGDIEVLIVAHDRGEKYKGVVEPHCFKLCTYDEFMMGHPFAELTSKYTEEELRAIVNSDGTTSAVMSASKVEVCMNPEKFGEYTLSTEEREQLRKEMTELLGEYYYSPTKKGLDTILDEWVKNKGWMINLFKKHPKYNGKYQIVFDSDYDRVCNKEVLAEFAQWIKDVRKQVLVEYKIGIYTYADICDIVARLRRKRDLIHRLYAEDVHSVILDGKKVSYYEEEYEHFDDIKQKFEEAYRRDEVADINGNLYTYSSYKIYSCLNKVASLIKGMTQHIATDTFAEAVNNFFPSTKAVAKQKVTRIVGRIMKLTGLDKVEDYNKQYAKYCDAINPLVIKRYTIMSCHPVDYLTMSFGNSWASCHTIDKYNKRKMKNGYSGGYSSGTESYMLDGSSFVYYTVDKDYKGDTIELEPKINRNMFHMGEDKLIQGRVYPQTTDGEDGMYKQIREIAQKVIADCLEAPNLWKNVKGKHECTSCISTQGTHYRDYANFDDCNVSYLMKEEGATRNLKRITVGHTPICPHCGKEHGAEDCIECRFCYDPKTVCTHCGEVHSMRNMHLINDEWYCDEHSFYCEYHERFEIGARNYVDDYYSGAYVCDEGLNEGNFILCPICGEWHHEWLTTVDGNNFCGSRCAEEAGYIRRNYSWVREEREAI